MPEFYFIQRPDGYFIIEDANGKNITREVYDEWFRKGNNMKRTSKNYKKRRRLHGLTLGKGIAITTMAAVSLAALPGCDLNESGGSQIVVDPTSSFVVIDGQTVTPTPAITDGKGKQTVTPTPTGAANSEASTQTGSTTVGNTNNNGNGSGKTATPTPKPTNNTTSTSSATPTPKPSGQGSGNATATPNPTNNSTNNTTAEPTSTPSSSSEQTSGGGGSSSGSGSESSSGSSSGGSSHTADPYSESCDCPYCSGDVSYRSTRTVHHDAVTHDETEVYYDRIVRTYRYTINWSGSFENYCEENGIEVPSAPSTTGSVVFDSDWNTIDDSGEDAALDRIFEAADNIATDLGYNNIAFSYINEVIGDEYEGRHENTTTVVDEEAWDENIPAGWYCDSCDYYSSSIPNEYEI